MSELVVALSRVEWVALGYVALVAAAGAYVAWLLVRGGQR